MIMIPEHRLFVALVCTAAIIGSPFTAARAAAPMGFSGTASLDASIGTGETSIMAGDAADGWGISAAGAFGLGSFGLEVNGAWHDLSDGSVNLCFAPFGCPLSDSWNVAGSLFWAPSIVRLGATIGYAALAAEGGFDANMTTYGGFGEVFLGERATLSLKGGAVSSHISTGGVNPERDDSGSYAGSAITGYIMPNLALVGSVDHLSMFDNPVTAYSIAAEFLLASAPIAFFGGYSYVNVDDIYDNPANVFSIGVRVYTGQGSLVERHRTGTLGYAGTPFATTLNAGF